MGRNDLAVVFSRQFNAGIKAGIKAVSKNAKSKDPVKRAACKEMLNVATKLSRLKLWEDNEAFELKARPDHSGSRALAEQFEYLLSEIGSNALKLKAGRELIVSERLRSGIKSANIFGQKLLSDAFESKLKRKIRAPVARKKRKLK